FFQKFPDTRTFPPTCVQAWITRENINRIMADAGVPAEVDVLSIDVDGMDYWIWESLTHTSARIVILEYNNVLPAELSVTVPYAEEFLVREADFMGASLAALTKLSRRKGYRLVGCNRLSYNAIFLCAGVGEEFFPEITAEECLQRPYPRQ